MDLKDLFKVIFSEKRIINNNSYFEFTTNYKRVVPELPTSKIKFTIELYNSQVLPLIDAENIRNFNLTFHFENKVTPFSETPWSKDWYHSQLVFHGSVDTKSVNLNYECLAEICGFQSNDFNRNFKTKVNVEKLSEQLNKVLELHDLLKNHRAQIIKLITESNSI